MRTEQIVREELQEHLDKISKLRKELNKFRKVEPVKLIPMNETLNTLQDCRRKEFDDAEINKVMELAR